MKKSLSQMRSRRGTALIVVLMFVVLMTVVVLAFFMKATAFRGLSQSAVSEFKTDTLARSALAITVADLRQEIKNGSTLKTFGNASVFYPTTSANAIPMRSGNPALESDGTDPIPNLIRRSVRSDAIASPGVASRASAASSVTPSWNGRFISPARWNKHYLIPRDPALFGGANATKVGTDPVPSFVAPDWVYVTENGPEVLTASKRSVIGRYAFAIYDEGGLLDINVAGYPSNTPVETKPHPNPNPNNRPSWGSGKKEALTFADLTVLGLTQTEVDQVVGWRNFATAQPTGVFPAFAFDTAAALRVHEAALANDSGFLEVSGTTWLSGGQTKTDQMFTSRQQLLKFRNQVGFSQDALQYLGTFSRDLEQPSFTPNPGRPRVRADWNSNITTYGSGNDGYNLDRGADPATDINPPFLDVRVKDPFVRADGTTAVTGEPLVKSRFPLSRLGLLLKTATASKSDADPIYRNFGLYRGSASSPWRYDHGDARGVLRLDEVADEGREPDFIELLKAAIEVGSLGKGANPAATLAYLQTQHREDTLTTLHLLQIAANIIDQYDSDGYPTRIQIQDAGGNTKEVVGLEDLPSIYHIRPRLSYVSANVGRLLFQPVVWNPNDPASGIPSSAPTDFRIRARTVDPAQQMIVKVEYNGGVSVIDLNPDWDEAVPLYGPVTFRAGESGGYHGFRQPALLGESNLPTGSHASGNDFSQQVLSPIMPGTSLVGLVVADYPLKLPRPDPTMGMGYAQQLRPGGPDSGIEYILEYLDGGDWVKYNSFVGREELTSHAIGPISSSSVFTDANLQTRAASIMADGTAFEGESCKTIDKVDPSISGYPTRWWGMTRADPRTSRWGAYVWQFSNLPRVLDRSNNIYATHREGTGVSYSTHHTRLRDRGFVGAGTNPVNLQGQHYFNSKTWHRGYQFGYWAENSVRPPAGATETAEESRRFNRDPDGIPRRAMGGYATDPVQGGSASNLYGLPLATNNFASRPIILNRPFQNVAELGMASRGDMWKNISFAFPESGDSALLDVFCIEEPAREDGLVAGRVNLNTRQAPVLQAILAGTVADPLDSTQICSPTEARELADALVARTSNTVASARKGPLGNKADLVGRWDPDPTKNLVTDPDPEFHFSGFSGDIGTVASLSGQPGSLIPRRREAAIRALASVGTARTWNVLIDVIAQSGKFSVEGASLDRFVVEGEKRYWLHVAIDRLTGEVLDQQMEMVTE